jgi:Protein of unknown function (DUF2470)
MATPNPAAMKARIMTHMNADHSDSLEDYLKFYNNINAAPQSAKLVDFDVDFMKIEYTDKSGAVQSSIVKINPPMSSLSEARVKMVAMAEEAVGKSFHQPPDLPTISASPAPAKDTIGWTPPELMGWGSLLSISFGFWALSHDYPISPDGPLQAVLPAVVVEFTRRFREQFFAIMIGIHVIEGIVVMKKCLEEGVALPLLLLWTVNGFFEGGPAIVRLNKLIEKRKK